MNKFEQLIEFVINDEEQKARELFHDIVVEKSRAIYESLMNEEAEEGEEELDESFGEPLADSADDLVDDVEMDETSMAEADEEGEEDDSEEMSFGGEEEGEAEPEELEDRVVDLEDKLDELMAEFEAMMGGEDADMQGDEEFEPDAGGDAMATDDTAEIMPMAESAGQTENKSAAEWLRDPRLETQVNMLSVDGVSMMENPAKGFKSFDNYPHRYDTMQASNPMYFNEFLKVVAAKNPNASVTAVMSAVRPQPAMAEALELKAAPRPVTSEEGGVNKKSTVAANAGAKGPVGNTVKPVSTGTSMGGRHDAAGAYSNTVKDLGATPTQEAGKKAFKTAAPAPVKTQASGVNTRSPVARG